MRELVKHEGPYNITGNNPLSSDVERKLLNYVRPELGGFFIDCTFGGGGYTKELLKFSNTKVIALDRDKVAKKNADSIKKIYPERFSFHNEKFSNLDKVLEGNQIKADSIIFDLGLSSFQLRDLSRGFSFKSKDRIDMSMGLSSLSAEEVINNYEENDLKLIIKIFGEENDASRIAREYYKRKKN